MIFSLLIMSNFKTQLANLGQTFAIDKAESKQFKYLGLNLC